MKILITLALLLTMHFSIGQIIIQRDPAIDKMVKQVSSDSLKAYVAKMVSFGTRHTLSTQADKAKGIGAARKWVLSKFVEFSKKTNGRLTAIIDTTTLQPDGRRINARVLLGNVMATLKGSDPNDDRIYLISGHLDSRNSDDMNIDRVAPGANDDASGVAAAIECVRILSQQSYPATIIFLAVSSEEQGLQGAAFLADKAKKNNWNIDGMLNNDIIGSNNSNETNIIDNSRIRVFSEGLPAFETEKASVDIRRLGLENDGKARQLARYVKEVGERYVENLEVVMVYRNDRYNRGGDHRPFVQKGFTAVRITEMNENFLHQHQDVREEKGVKYGDLIEFMDFEYLRKNTAMNLACLANLAKSPSPPQEVKIDVRGLSNSTSLNWKSPKSGKVKGYYVLMRETTSAVWQKKFFTTQTELRLPYSKDNYFFAVQSVTEDGNEGLPVIPTSSRN